MENSLSLLPPSVELENLVLLKKAASAHRYLAELKGVAASIPNQDILINSLSLQEARESSAIENIVTTTDDLYRTDLELHQGADPVAKEVSRYAIAMKKGYSLLEQKGILTVNQIVEIQAILLNTNAGYRKLPGTELRDGRDGRTVYVPPQHHDEIVSLMVNLESFINDDQMCSADPLIKMAVLHYQFESIHPFYDGNGRTGRILNVLYLVQQGLLDSPILYLSRYIMRNKAEYYRLLDHVRRENSWDEWIWYMLDAVEKTSQNTIAMIAKIKDTLQSYKQNIRSSYSFYSQDLMNSLFKHPYTKTDYIMRDLNVSRPTAVKYLDTLSRDGLLEKKQAGRGAYYINSALVKILSA
jgi:Fic family protein